MQIIELLIWNEQLVGKLYSIYASRFPEERRFWLAKVAEENVHADLLEGIQLIVDEIPSFSREGRFNLEAVESTIALLKDLIQKAQSCSLVEALTAAQVIENSLVEMEFFRIISDDSILVRNAFAQIEKDTKKHRDEIKGLLAKYTQKQ